MKILFISHRIPYPPNKGEKLRSYNFLRHLAKEHEIYLASNIDDPMDKESAAALSSQVKGLIVDTIHPLFRKITSSTALLRSSPISAKYFYSDKVQKWIDELLDNTDIEAVFCSSSPSAEYVFRSRHYRGKLKKLLLVMDLIDVDSYKWEQYAQRSGGLFRLIYRLESIYLKRYEERISKEFSHILLVSDAEGKLFSDRIPTARPECVMNGVDLDYFAAGSHPALPKEGPVLAFVGVMDYWPNVDGVRWFVGNVLPRVRDVFGNVTFYVVGTRPTSSIRNMARTSEGVKVTGYVDDVRGYIAGSDVCVFPLRIARGVQNKVLEAMAMGKPVVCTTKALQAIPAEEGKEVLAADGASEFADHVIGLLRDRRRIEEMGRNARHFVERNFRWENNLARLDGIFGD